jgi:hypothetical protein
VSDIKEIEIAKDVFIQYDPEDTWFGIVDKDNSWYDDLGAIVLSKEDLQILIDELQKLKVHLERIE